MSYTPISAQPTSGQTPWYAPMAAWMDSVETAIGETDAGWEAHVATSALHVPAPGVNGQVLTLVGGVRAWATPASGVTDHGLLTGLSDPDHPIGAVVGLQTALDTKAVVGHNHSGTYDPAGTASTLVGTHAAASDPHPGYLTPAEGDAAYAALAFAVPSGGTLGQVVTKQASGFAWADPTGGGSVASPYTLTSTAVGQTPLTLKGFAGQTGNLLEVRDSANTLQWSINPSQEMRLGPAVGSVNGTVRVGISDPLRNGVMVKMAAAQGIGTKGYVLTDNGGVEKWSVDKDGMINALNLGGAFGIVGGIVLSAVATVPAGLPNDTLIFREPA